MLQCFTLAVCSILKYLLQVHMKTTWTLGQKCFAAKQPILELTSKCQTIPVLNFVKLSWKVFEATTTLFSQVLK